MEEFVVDMNFDFEDEELHNLIKCLHQISYNKQRNFAQMCFTIYNIWFYCKGNYWKAKDNEYYNSYKLLAKFGFDKKSVGRYKQCFERYIQGTTFENVYIKTYFSEFSPSKLFELLSLSSETLESEIDKKLIVPTMTVKQIREHIKTLKDGTDKAEKVIENSVEINEDEIPLAYNPTQKYEYSYFESKTKNQLLNIVWELQKAYQKLKSKGEEKNVGKK